MAQSKAGQSPRTAELSLAELLKLGGLSASAADGVEIAGPTDPVLATRYRAVTPGAAAIAATGVAASELWALRTGRRQQVRVVGRAAAAALRGSRFLKIDGKTPEEDPEKITGFYQLRDGRWMYLRRWSGPWRSATASSSRMRSSSPAEWAPS